MIDVRIEALIEPKAAPRPRAFARMGPNGKPFARVHVPTDAQNWKAQLAQLAREQMPKEIIDEPIRVDVLFVLKRPKRLMRKSDPDGLLWAPVKPDRDNLDKQVLDALKPFWRDDTLVVAGSLFKAYAEKAGRPRVVVRIRSVPSVEMSCFDATLAALVGGFEGGVR